MGLALPWLALLWPESPHRMIVSTPTLRCSRACTRSGRDAGCSRVSHLHPESSHTRPFRGSLAVAGPRFKGGGEIQHFARFVFHFLLLGSGGGLCRTVWHLRHVRSAFPAVGQPRSLRGCHPVGGSGIILPLLLNLNLIMGSPATMGHYGVPSHDARVSNDVSAVTQDIGRSYGVTR